MSENEAPKEIWLQRDGYSDFWLGETYTTWCEDKINDDDIKYTRADTAWIPVSERLPSCEGEWLLLVDNGNRLYGMLWWRDGDHVVWKALVMTEAGPVFKTMVNVTHWCNLPPLPEADNE